MTDKTAELGIALQAFLNSDVASRHATFRARARVFLASCASATELEGAVGSMPDDAAKEARSELESFYAKAWSFVAQLHDLN